MAEPFLKQIAEHFYNLTSTPGATPLHQYRFIFHNQRAGIFLCHYLKQCAGEAPILLPECTTMNNLLRQRLHMAGEEDPNSELLIIHKIYLAYRQVMGLTYEERSFEDFYDFGKSLLRDFDDIDKHLVEVDSFLENILNHKELSEDLTTFLSKRQWEGICKLIYEKDAKLPELTTKEGSKSEEMKKRFLDFWMKLPEIYDTAKGLMKEEGLAYEGMMLREAAEQIKGGKLSLTDDGMITVFVGLNAQTPAMYRILDHFRDTGKAIFYWDYFTDPILKSPGLAGSFVGRNTSAYPAPTTGDYHINFDVPDQAHELRTALISTASAVAQTGAIRKLIEDDNREDGWKKIVQSLSDTNDSDPLFDSREPLKTAIVLPDENLLLPLLSNMPKGIGKINVTMGYPIKGIPVAAMLSLLLKYWSNYYKRNRRYRLTEVCEILMLAALSKFFSDKEMAKAREGLKDKLIKEKKFFISGNELQSLIVDHFPDESRTRKILLTIFREADTLCEPTTDGVCYPEGAVLTTQVDDLLKLLITETAPADEEEDPEQGMIKYIRRELILPQLTSQRAYCKRHAESATNPFTYSVVTDLLRTTIARARVPFSGMPLRGLQVMGLLETRGLDFDTVIIPDASEGTLPTATQLDTTIPFSLRKGYNLPTTDLQEQTRAYNFFRLMSRAKRVVFLYDSRTGDASAGEPSRYVQLLRDVYGVPMYEAEASFPLTGTEAGGDFIEDKTLVSQYRADVNDQSTVAVKHLSASRMRDFHTCPRRFYYTAIEGIRDDENLSGVLDKRDSGTLFHTAMQSLYKESEGEKDGLSRESLSKILEGDAIDNAVAESAKKLHLETKKSDYNDNQLEMTRKLVRRMVEADLERVQAGGDITYVGGEIEIETAYEGANFKLIIDRIDVQDDTVNIIDYKTGRDKTECDLSKWPTDAKKLVECLKQAKKINGAVIQLLYYCDVMLESGELNRLLSDKNLKVRPMILKPGAPDINDGIITLKVPKEIDPNPVVISDYRTNVDSSIKEWLREAVRLILDEDFSFAVEAGDASGCNYCPASMLCEKFVPKSW
ncbi:PD-(D/E)XK nuclease family protein [Porphyromonas bennonis]|uniref:PD-(D/E)XK nuclease family protein n=1 Tax=Porphyromonas bennonis TaxID=501496 RepID=UPI0003616828|nr:PD-(D/E)XK nuclease family protein [Porphyromonas bennonis]